jgi:hypothetical protein
LVRLRVVFRRVVERLAELLGALLVELLRLLELLRLVVLRVVELFARALVVLFRRVVERLAVLFLRAVEVLRRVVERFAVLFRRVLFRRVVELFARALVVLFRRVVERLAVLFLRAVEVLRRVVERFAVLFLLVLFLRVVPAFARVDRLAEPRVDRELFVAVRARRFFTGRAAISSARPSSPRSSYESLKGSYWRSCSGLKPSGISTSICGPLSHVPRDAPDIALPRNTMFRTRGRAYNQLEVCASFARPSSVRYAQGGRDPCPLERYTTGATRSTSRSQPH